MIFEQEYIVFQLLDVLRIENENIKTQDANRNFSALSFRYEADTVLETKQKKTELFKNTICYVPSSFDYTRTSKKDKLIVVHFKAFNYHAKELEVFIPDNYNKYRVLFEEILDCWNRKEPDYLYKASSLLNQIFAELYKENRTLHSNTSKIYQSVEYIEKNYLKKDFSLTVASKKSFISEVYFRTLFKKEFGISPKKYIIEKRIKYATALIITGYYSLQEVSDMCGYNDYKHFSVEFKKLMGISPSKYTYNFKKAT